MPLRNRAATRKIQDHVKPASGWLAAIIDVGIGPKTVHEVDLAGAAYTRHVRARVFRELHGERPAGGAKDVVTGRELGNRVTDVFDGARDVDTTRLHAGVAVVASLVVLSNVIVTCRSLLRRH